MKMVKYTCPECGGSKWCNSEKDSGTLGVFTVTKCVRCGWVWSCKPSDLLIRKKESGECDAPAAEKN